MKLRVKGSDCLLLSTLFIILKGLGIISWSWVVVFLPSLLFHSIWFVVSTYVWVFKDVKWWKVVLFNLIVLTALIFLSNALPKI